MAAEQYWVEAAIRDAESRPSSAPTNLRSLIVESGPSRTRARSFLTPSLPQAPSMPLVTILRMAMSIGTLAEKAPRSNLGRALQRPIPDAPSTRAPNVLGATGDAKLDGIADRLLGFARLDSGWDGYAAKAPTHRAIDDALLLLKFLGHRALCLQPSVNSSGEITLFLRSAQRYLDIGLTGDGTYSFFGIDPQGRKFYTDDRPIGDSINDKDLTHLLSVC